MTFNTLLLPSQFFLIRIIYWFSIHHNKSLYTIIFTLSLKLWFYYLHRPCTIQTLLRLKDDLYLDKSGDLKRLFVWDSNLNHTHTSQIIRHVNPSHTLLLPFFRFLDSLFSSTPRSGYRSRVEYLMGPQIFRSMSTGYLSC